MLGKNTDNPRVLEFNPLYYISRYQIFGIKLKTAK